LCGAAIAGLLLGIASSGEPVCLDKTERERSTGTAFVVFSPDGKWLAAAMHWEIAVWDFATREKVATKPYKIVKPYDAGFAAIAFMPDSQGIVHADDGGRVCLWDGSAGWADGTERELLGQRVDADGRPITGHICVQEIAISPDGKLLAVPRGRRTIKVVEIATGKEVGDLDIGHSVNSVQFAEEGRVLVVGTPGTTRDNPEVQFWDMDTLTAKETLRIVKPPKVFAVVSPAILSPTEKLLAVPLDMLNRATEIRFYELPSCRWTTLANNGRLMPSLAFSRDGSLLAVPTHHGRNDPAAVLVWDLRAKSWRRFDSPAEIAQKNVAFLNAKFSPDGRYLAGGLFHPQVAVCIWDLQAEADTSESSGTSR